jgi:hypothetical protein
MEDDGFGLPDAKANVQASGHLIADALKLNHLPLLEDDLF